MKGRCFRAIWKMVWVAFFCANAAGQEAAKLHPNVLLIITDDLKEEHLGFTSGGMTALTPHMDQLAKSGIYFSRAYVTSSVCTPSRYSILTGRYASLCRTPEMDITAAENGMHRVKWQTWIYPDSDNLVRLLKSAGYFTGYVGKCDGFKKREPQRVPPESDPRDPVVKKVLIENQQRLVEDVKQIGFDYAASLAWANPPHNPCKELQGHNIEWEVKGALDFLDAAVKKDQPFFLCFATTLLHWPDPMKDIRNADTRRTHMGYLDKPIDVQPLRQSTIDRVKASGLDENSAITTWLDDGIGALLTRLDRLGLTENTLIVFINDNRTDDGKGSCYETGAHIPLIISWKGALGGGRVSDALVANIDIVPTICDAIGVDIPGGYVQSGTSLMPHLRGEDAVPHDSVFLEIGNTRAVVTQDGWKYLALRIPYETAGVPKKKISHMSYKAGDVNGIELKTMKLYSNLYWDENQLFDLNRDPRETRNEWASPEKRPQAKKLVNIMEEYLKEMPGIFPLQPLAE